jgi:hypothetical protein
VIPKSIIYRLTHSSLLAARLRGGGHSEEARRFVRKFLETENLSAQLDFFQDHNFEVVCQYAAIVDSSVGPQLIEALEKCREQSIARSKDLKARHVSIVRNIGLSTYSRNLENLSRILDHADFVAVLKDGGPVVIPPPPETEVMTELDHEYPSALRPRSSSVVCNLSWDTVHGNGDETILLSQSNSEIRWILWVRTVLYDWIHESRPRLLINPIACTRRAFCGSAAAAEHLLSAYLFDQYNKWDQLPYCFEPGLVDETDYARIRRDLTEHAEE